MLGSFSFSFFMKNLNVYKMHDQVFRRMKHVVIYCNIHSIVITCRALQYIVMFII